MTQRYAGAIMARRTEMDTEDVIVSSMHISAVALTADTSNEAVEALWNAAARIYPGQEGWHERQCSLVGFGEVPAAPVALPVTPAIRLQGQAESVEGMDWVKTIDSLMEEEEVIILIGGRAGKVNGTLNIMHPGSLDWTPDVDVRSLASFQEVMRQMMRSWENLGKYVSEEGGSGEVT